MTTVVWIAFLALAVIGLAIPIIRAVRRPGPPSECAFGSEAALSDLGPVFERLSARIDALEAEVDDLSASVAGLRDDNEVLQRMIENRSEPGGS